MEKELVKHEMKSELEGETTKTEIRGVHRGNLWIGSNNQNRAELLQIRTVQRWFAFGLFFTKALSPSSGQAEMSRVRRSEACSLLGTRFLLWNPDCFSFPSYVLGTTFLF